MFCSQCGKEIADDSQFCSKCGRAVSATIPTQAARPDRQVTTWTWVLVLLLAILGGWALINVSSHTANGQAPVQLPSIIAFPRTQVLVNTSMTVKALGYSYYKFVVPSGSRKVSVDGHFSATGGMGNDVEVLILGEDEFVNFQNGHNTSTYYNSGKVTQDAISATLPDRSGTFYLVFNNNFSLLTPKAVQANATLHYSL